MNPKLHLALSRPGFAPVLVEELRDRYALKGEALNAAAVALPETAKLPPLDQTIFVRQYLPRATQVRTADQAKAVEQIVKRLEVTAQRANRQKGRWSLHAFALDDDPCTQHAARLEKAVLAAVKARIPRLAKRYVAPAELSEAAAAKLDDFLVQLYVPALDELWLSVANAGTEVSPWIAGNRRMRDRVGAPSRSARKLEEALVVLGREPRPGETVVDLGAAPGGWSFSMARYGAHVTAVDHAELALPEKRLKGEVTHLKENGLKYLPPKPVDWMCCDMVVGSRETLKVLARWLDEGAMRNFVVNVKLPQAEPWPAIKEALELLAGKAWSVMKAKHLYHDRREITLMGSRAGD